MTTSLLLLSILCSVTLPTGESREPVALPHFPDRIHAFVWRNWPIAPLDAMARVLDTSPDKVLNLGKAMGLPDKPPISEAQLARTYITIIRANWHLLPYEQLLDLLGWTEAKLAYTLREDDFLYIKLGQVKPFCPPLRYTEPDDAMLTRQREMAAIVRGHFGSMAGAWVEPPLTFIPTLSTPPETTTHASLESTFDPRFCYSYFALYGDPLLEHDPFPEGYLQRLSAAGVNGVWLHGVLYKLSPFPWDESLSLHWEQRLDALRALTERAAAHDIGVYLYLNEPRTMPLTFFEAHPELRGVIQGEHAGLCTSAPEVQDYLRNSIARIASAAPALAGFFTITASENPTNCWSHGRGADCPRCSERGAPAVIAEVNSILMDGIRQANSRARLIAWDWGWNEDWAPEAIALLPEETMFMSVSEWHTSIRRGGIDSIVGEYSISAVGPGPRAQRHWSAAQDRGLPTVAKIQANNTWELSAVPYIPAVANVAQHAAALRDTGVSGLMLGWTLGGFPSPNLEVVHALGQRTEDGRRLTPDDAMLLVARRRYGEAASDVVNAWHVMSNAFSQFPYHIGVVYNAPLQVGPANLFHGEPTGYAATMVGIPYDDVNTWRAVYPPDVFAEQLEQCARGFLEGAALLRDARDASIAKKTLESEANIAEAAAIHFQSVANQTRFVVLRDARATSDTPEQFNADLDALLESELRLAKRMHHLQAHDSRLGFEATNHYFYTPADLAEKVVNLVHLRRSFGLKATTSVSDATSPLSAP